MSKLITPIELDYKKKAEKQVIDTFILNPSVFTEESKDGQSTGARFAAWLLLKHVYNMPYNKIAQLYNKCYATVRYGVNMAIARMYPSILNINLYENPVLDVDKLGKTRGKRVSK